MGRVMAVSIIPCHSWSSPTTLNQQHPDCFQTIHCSALRPLSIAICLRSSMAEAVGIIASGISITGLIGTITKAAMQIRTLYHEIQDAPDEMAFRPQELQILSDILKQSSAVSLAAKSLCELCFSELQLILVELQSQIYQSRGLKRKVASAKVVVKKDVMNKLDTRLERSIRLLMLANSTRMESTQRLVLRNMDALKSTQNLILNNQGAMT